MNKFRNVCWTLLLLIVLTGTYIAQNGRVGSSQGVLAYAKASPHPSSILLKLPRGEKFRLSLVPEFDVGKHVVVLELVLQRPDKKGDDSNLLDSTGKLHGYQPYFFAASDFARGAQKSAYGELRVIDVHRLGMEMRITVAEVSVEQITPSPSQGPGYEFENLTLEITTQSPGEETSR